MGAADLCLSRRETDVSDIKFPDERQLTYRHSAPIVDPCQPSRRGETRKDDMHAIKTLREANKIARELGLVRGNGTYNGAAYWTNAYGQIVTRERLAELAGY